MIGTLIACDVHRIEAADPYSDGYDATVARNVREQDGNARPAIVSPLPSIEDYDTVLLASGIWNVRAPMIMTTFAESYDFTGKTVHPVTTHAMSGLGTTERDYARSCPGAVHRRRASGAGRDSPGRRAGCRGLAAPGTAPPGLFTHCRVISPQSIPIHCSHLRKGSIMNDSN